jgi:hypothetical protein
VDPSTEPTSTMSTSTHATGTQPTSTQTTSTPPTGMSKEDWEKLDIRERSIIRLCLTDSVLLNVSRESTTNELWDKEEFVSIKVPGKQVVSSKEVISS